MSVYYNTTVPLFRFAKSFTFSYFPDCRLRPSENARRYADLAHSNRKRSDFAVRKWIFNLKKEKELLANNDELTSLVFGQVKCVICFSPMSKHGVG